MTTSQTPLRLYHYPRCSTSCQVLSDLLEQGIAVEVCQYIDHAPSLADLQRLHAKSGQAARYLLREKEPLAQGLANADDATILAAIAAHPILLNRPVIETERQVFVCRPAQQLAAILAQLKD